MKIIKRIRNHISYKKKIAWFSRQGGEIKAPFNISNCDLINFTPPHIYRAGFMV